MNEILASHTQQPEERIAEDTERDYYMGADEARDYGIVDTVVSQRKLAAADTLELSRDS